VSLQSIHPGTPPQKFLAVQSKQSNRILPQDQRSDFVLDGDLSRNRLAIVRRDQRIVDPNKTLFLSSVFAY